MTRFIIVSSRPSVKSHRKVHRRNGPWGPFAITQPTIYFLALLGAGPTAKLAIGVKAALDQLGKK
jgi:hypothetical protein